MASRWAPRQSALHEESEAPGHGSAKREDAAWNPNEYSGGLSRLHHTNANRRSRHARAMRPHRAKLSFAEKSVRIFDGDDQILRPSPQRDPAPHHKYMTMVFCIAERISSCAKRSTHSSLTPMCSRCPAMKCGREKNRRSYTPSARTRYDRRARSSMTKAGRHFRARSKRLLVVGHSSKCFRYIASVTSKIGGAEDQAPTGSETKGLMLKRWNKSWLSTLSTVERLSSTMQQTLTRLTICD